MSVAASTIFMIGRILFGGFFLFSGINHFRHVAAMAPYAVSKGVPAPKGAVIVSGVLILLGGLSVLLGFWPPIGALLIAIFLVVVTPKMHAFWKVSEPTQRMGEQINFMKNLALLGATLIIGIIPSPWPLSLSR